MSFDTLVVLVVFFLLPPLLSVLGPWLRKRLEALEQGLNQRVDGPPRSIPVGHAAAPVATRAAMAPQVSPAGARSAEMRTFSGRSAAMAGLGSRSQLRRSMVLMTVLGPCRALDPP